MNAWWKKVDKISPGTIWVEEEYDSRPHDETDDPTLDVNDRIYFEIAPNKDIFQQRGRGDRFVKYFDGDPRWYYYGCFSATRSFPNSDQHIMLIQKNVKSYDAQKRNLRIEFVDSGSSLKETTVIVATTNRA